MHNASLSTLDEPREEEEVPGNRDSEPGLIRGAH